MRPPQAPPDRSCSSASVNCRYAGYHSLSGSPSLLGIGNLNEIVSRA